MTCGAAARAIDGTFILFYLLMGAPRADSQKLRAW
jgi:hypothetical protein